MPITSNDRMSNTSYHKSGKPTWWCRCDGNFLDVPKTRGDQYLTLSDDFIAQNKGKKIVIGVGKYGLAIRQTIVL